MSVLSAIYGAGVSIRNRLYDRGTLKARRLSAPVISVGNLSVGGAGKTPFVILLGELLHQRGIVFDVLSRGYGRSTRGVQRVDPNGTPRDFGDEPLLIARRLGCPVVVGEDRYEAGLFAEKELDAQLHILDDAFQHRSLARDFDIVLITPENLHDSLLPNGRLREPLASLQRADAVVVTEPINAANLPLPVMKVWRVQRGISVEGVSQSPIAFCGIARPTKFFEQLEDAGIRSSAHISFHDHHTYSSADVRKLLKMRGQSSAGGFITTEKDAINLGPRLSNLGDVAIARVTMQLTEPADALDTMLAVIADRMRGREKIKGQ